MIYRPEIDGLRAIAVAAVVLYHAKIEFFGSALFEGGYIGVDVFFVISGYLIGKNIFAEYQERQKIDFWAFYERRARRLLPVLLTVICASFVASWFILLPSSFVEFGKSVPAAILFVSNFFFLEATTAYGADDSLFKPLLHTWSLSVEEQFYILFPIAALGLLKFGRGTPFILSGAALLSLFYAHWMGQRYPENNFFLLPGRIWELLAGVLLAHQDVYRRTISLGYADSFLAGVGLLLIGASTLVFSATTLHPGLPTIAPVLGTLMVIAFAKTDNLTGRLLAFSPLVGLGLLSYSLYLWHFPIFALLRLNDPQVSVTALLIGIILSLLLSAASYRWIEQPFRNRQIIPRLLFARAVGYFALATIFLCAIVFNRHGDFGRFDYIKSSLPGYQIDNADLEDSRTEFIIDIGEKAEFRNNTLKVLVIGNSHAEDLFSAVEQNAILFPKFSFQLYVIQVACFNEDRSNTREFFSNQTYLNSDVILIAPQYAFGRRCQFGDKHFQSDMSGIERLIERAIEDGKMISVASNSVEFAEVGSEALIDSIVVRNLPRSDSDRVELISEVNRSYFENRNTYRDGVEAINKIVQDLAEKYELTYLNKEDFICDRVARTCDAMTTEGIKVFTDHSHMSVEGALYLGKNLYEEGWLDPLLQVMQSQR